MVAILTKDYFDSFIWLVTHMTRRKGDLFDFDKWIHLTWFHP